MKDTMAETIILPSFPIRKVITEANADYVSADNTFEVAQYHDLTTFDGITDHVWETLLLSPFSLDPKERATRTFEEVCEFCQSVGLDDELLHKIVKSVYDRNVDENISGEAGDVMITLMAAMKSLNISGLDVAKQKALRFREQLPAIIERNKGKLRA